MKWKKSQLLYNLSKEESYSFSHAAIPFVEYDNDKILRIYFSSRNALGYSQPYWIDVDYVNCFKIIRKSEIILSLGDLGTFDECGIMPSWIVNVDGKKFLYYIGWNPQVTVSYRLSIGLATSLDNGHSFKKFSIGPICDRSVEEPFFNTAPCVIFENGLWRMWYISCTGWRTINNYPEPQYHVKYAESKDGIYWGKSGHICIDYNDEMEAIGRPAVINISGLYFMFFSFRKLVNYRINSLSAYKIGLAVSTDGLKWTVTHSPLIQQEVLTDWDSEMQEYCSPILIGDHLFLFYNGNGFGKTGVGYTSILLEEFLAEFII